MWVKLLAWLKEFLAPKAKPVLVKKPVTPGVIENISPIDLRPPDITPWLSIAKREVGVIEIEGAKSNKKIEEYHKAVGLNAKDDVAWCAAFVGWCLEKSKYKSTNSAMARSYFRFGLPMDIPRMGCIVVFWRNHPSASSGHVGFYIGETDKEILVLGGNQNNQVCEKYYPKSQLLGYRWPKDKI